MQNKGIFGAAAVMAAVLAVAFVGCGDDEPTVPEAESQVCTDLGDLATAIEGVQDLTADSTVDEAQSAVDAVQSARTTCVFRQDLDRPKQTPWRLGGRPAEQHSRRVRLRYHRRGVGGHPVVGGRSGEHSRRG